MFQITEKWWLACATALILMMGYQPVLAEEMAEDMTEDMAEEMADMQTPSLYDRLGGLMPISVVVSDFLDAVVPDPVLNANPAIDAARQRVPTPYLKYQVTAQVCQATGGPCQYQGRTMKESHAHLNITAGEWEQMVVLFKGVLAKHNVPEQETGELLAIIDSTRADIVTPAMN